MLGKQIDVFPLAYQRIDPGGQVFVKYGRFFGQFLKTKHLG
ncbi:MAG: hypothetical protein WA215_11880 [Candidatus Cybelea sp.]